MVTMGTGFICIARRGPFLLSEQNYFTNLTFSFSQLSDLAALSCLIFKNIGKCGLLEKELKRRSLSNFLKTGTTLFWRLPEIKSVCKQM